MPILSTSAMRSAPCVGSGTLYVGLKCCASVSGLVASLSGIYDILSTPALQLLPQVAKHVGKRDLRVAQDAPGHLHLLGHERVFVEVERPPFARQPLQLAARGRLVNFLLGDELEG